MDRNISIIGAGTYGEVVKELVEILGYTVEAFYDDDNEKIGKYIDGVLVAGRIELEDIIKSKNEYVIAIGNNQLRKSLGESIKKKGANLPTLIHPKATISPSAKIGEGCIIHANSYIWTKVNINSFSIISPNTLLAHHTVIGEGGFVSSGANIGAGINFGSCVFIGIGATIMTGVVKLGDNCIIGAGSTVIKDVDANQVVAGVPAKIIRTITSK